MGFVFYDLETTGISPAYDQPLQFAAIEYGGAKVCHGSGGIVLLRAV